MVKALIVDDHPLFREALAYILSGVEPDSDCIGAESLEQATTAIRDDPSFDLVLLDLGLPGASGLAGVLTVRNMVPTTPIVVVSAVEDREVVQRAAQIGVSGYIAKSSGTDMIRTALSAILMGNTHFPPSLDQAAGGGGGDEGSDISQLTPRQLTVLSLLGEAKSNKQIAYELNISQETVKIHISAILRKLGVTSRAQAVKLAYKVR